MKKKEKNRNRHRFLLTFFSNDEKYDTKEVNDFILVKYFSNSSSNWEVAIYTKDSFSKRQQHLENQKAVNQQVLL